MNRSPTLLFDRRAYPCSSHLQIILQPENRHATFNVDVKVFSEPLHLFSLMHDIISSVPDWQTALAPRILLGLWHPRFLAPAREILPYCKRSFIGLSTSFAREYFWDSCEVFSIHFTTLAGWEGQRCVLTEIALVTVILLIGDVQVHRGLSCEWEESHGVDGQRADAHGRGCAAGR